MDLNANKRSLDHRTPTGGGDGFVYVDESQLGPWGDVRVGQIVASENGLPFTIHKTAESIFPVHWPGSLWSVRVVEAGRGHKPDDQRDILTSALSVQVIGEEPAHMIFGPKSEELVAFIAAVGHLTSDDACRLATMSDPPARAAFRRIMCEIALEYSIEISDDSDPLVKFIARKDLRMLPEVKAVFLATMALTNRAELLDGEIHDTSSWELLAPWRDVAPIIEATALGYTLNGRLHRTERELLTAPWTRFRTEA